MLLALALTGALIVAQISPPSHSTQLELKGRLSEYETREPKSPDALAAIAELAIDSNLKSNVFDVWLETCASQFVPAGSSCEKRLWETVKRPAAPARERARAAAVLSRGGDKGATAALGEIVSKMATRELVPLADDLRALPAETAVPMLSRMLSSSNTAEQIAACRALGYFDTSAVREALRAIVDASQPGLQPWNTCMVARARLKEPDAMLKLAGFSRGMEGEDLLDASETMLDNGNDQGTFLLRRLTREAAGATQLRAAAVLAATDPDAAAKVVDAKLDDPEPAVRAQALVTEARLKRSPSERVRRKLLDGDPIVQLRAAEALLQWAASQRP